MEPEAREWKSRIWERFFLVGSAAGSCRNVRLLATYAPKPERAEKQKHGSLEDQITALFASIDERRRKEPRHKGRIPNASLRFHANFGSSRVSVGANSNRRKYGQDGDEENYDGFALHVIVLALI
jgi:hypothetical protein